MGIYFLFKPLPGKDMDKWQRSQGRALLMLMYLVTLLASVGVIGLSSLLLNFAGQNSELCNYDSRCVRLHVCQCGYLYLVYTCIKACIFLFVFVVLDVHVYYMMCINVFLCVNDGSILVCAYKYLA